MNSHPIAVKTGGGKSVLSCLIDATQVQKQSPASVCFRKMSQSRCRRRSRRTPADVPLPTERVADATPDSELDGRESHILAAAVTETDTVIRFEGPNWLSVWTKTHPRNFRVLKNGIIPSHPVRKFISPVLQLSFHPPHVSNSAAASKRNMCVPALQRQREGEDEHEAGQPQPN